MFTVAGRVITSVGTLADSFPVMGIGDIDEKGTYTASVRLRSADAPEGWVSLPDRVVRFAPSGWLSVAAGPRDEDPVDVYPLYMILSVDRLRELPRKATAFTL
jgi:hypothetical protein